MKHISETYELRTMDKGTALHEATKRGYVNQAILFNAGFSFKEVQAIKERVEP